MTATGSITLSGNVTNLPGSETFGPLIRTFTNVIGQISVVSLSSGNNTVTIPSGTTGYVILGPNTSTPSAGYGGTLTYKPGGAGDTGTVFDPAGWIVMALPTSGAPSTFVINASTSTTITAWFW